MCGAQGVYISQKGFDAIKKGNIEVERIKYARKAVLVVLLPMTRTVY